MLSMHSKLIGLRFLLRGGRSRTRNLSNSVKSTESYKPDVKFNGNGQVLGQPSHFTHPYRLSEGEIIPGLRSEEFKARRYRLMDRIASYSIASDKKIKKHLVIVPSSQKKFMTEKIPYVFRQNSDFLYLSGCMEPDCVLVLTTDGVSDHESSLFLRGKDAHSELWDGPRTGVDQACQFFGVDKAYHISELENYLASYLKQNGTFLLWYDFLNDHNPSVHRTINDLLANMQKKAWDNPRPFVHRLRLYKSPSEQLLMKESCRIACGAITQTMKQSYAGVNEHELFAKVDYECRVNGAEYLAYPPVVAGGRRANIIHYINNDQVVCDGDMVLMDAGCEYHSYTSDITRTWPVSGYFTQEQRTLYDVVYSTQTDLIKLLMKFPSLDQLFNQMCQLLGKHLQEAAILSHKLSKEELSRAAYAFCPHHCSHFLGMDVHDTALIPRSIPLESGMVITVEPGVYITSDNKLADPRYHGLGVRIEDDVLITESGPVVMSDYCPKHADDIQELLHSR